MSAEQMRARPSAAPLYERLAADVASLITRGTLRPGDRVPSVRVLRRERGLSHATVARAYALLHAQGWLVARARSGYFVGEGATRRAALAAGVMAAGSHPRVAAPRAVSLTALMSDVAASGAAPGTGGWLGAAVPVPALLPAAALGRALARAATGVGPDGTADGALRYAPSDGEPALRAAFARRALFAGRALDAAEVVVTGGATEALALALRAVTRPGDVVAVESPTYFGVLPVLAALGLRALELPTDPDAGVRLDALAEVLARAEPRVAACLFVPTFHNPTGALMPDAAKRALVALLAAHDVPLIEDDIYGELHHGPLRPAACKSYDGAYDAEGGPGGEAARVLYVSSVSKTLAPGYRIGYLAAGRYTERVRLLKVAASLAAPTPTQRAVADYLSHGAYDRHLRRLRGVLAANVVRARGVVADAFPPGTRASRPAGGLVLWVTLPDDARPDAAVALYHAARREGIGVAPGPIFSAAGTPEAYGRCVRLNLAVRWDATVERALTRLGALAHGDAR